MLRKLISLLLALLLTATMLIPAFADTEDPGDPPSGGENPPPSCDHTYDNACDASCNLCGETRTVGDHSYGGWTSDASGHSGACTACGAPTSGSHTYSGWSYTDTTHSQSCTVCQYVSSGDHSWDAGQVEKQPSCVAGIKKYTCATCGGTKNEDITATGQHVYGAAYKVDENTHSWNCIGCSQPKTPEEHKWNTGTVTTEPSCQPGEKSFTCTVCPDTKTETLTPTGQHVYEYTSNEDTHTVTCKHGDLTADTKPHTWASEIVKEATCKELGKELKTCTVCQRQKTVDIPLLTTHTYTNKCDDTCDVCLQRTREAGHSLRIYYTVSAQAHWYSCSNCTEKFQYANHTPGPAATEKSPQLCLVCSYEIAPKLKHTHKYDKTLWENDKTGHWHQCESCEIEVDFSGHKYQGDCNGKCTVCGYENKDGHIYDDTYLSDETDHWRKCKLCDSLSVAQPHEVNTANSTCKVCGAAVAKPEEHVHKGGQWVTNDADHWQVCECGEHLLMGNHAWGEAEKNPDGTIKRTCIDCGQSRTELPAKNKSTGPWIVLLVVLVLCFLGTLFILIKVILSGRENNNFTA